MSVVKKRTFYWRAFVTFSMVFSILVIATSGTVLFVAPPGRIANWSYWAIGALTKANWQAVHTVFAFLFVVTAAFHVYFNWRVVVGYVKTRLGEGMRRKWELAASGAAVVGILAFTIAGVPPFSTVMAAGESLKNSWANPAVEPPVPHAEDWTLAKFAETTKISTEEATVNLKKAGIEVPSAETSLRDLAKRHEMTPQQVYSAAVGKSKTAGVPMAEGGGYGRKTVQQICDQLGITVQAGLDNLRQAGIEATASSSVRDLATKNGKRPIDVAKLIEGPGRE